MKTIRSAFVACLIAISVVTLPSVVIFTGCMNQSAATVTYKTLDTLGAGVDAAMKTAALLKVNGKITSAQWQTVADAHAMFLVAYNAAIDAAAVALDKASVPANVQALATDVLNIVASFQR